MRNEYTGGHETPKKTPFQEVIAIDARINAKQALLASKQDLYRSSTNPIKKLKLVSEIRDIESAIDELKKRSQFLCPESKQWSS